MKIAYFISNRTTFPADPNEIAASLTVAQNIITHLAPKHKITVYAAKGSQLPGVTIVDLDQEPFTIDASLAGDDWVTKATLGMKQIYLGEIFKDANKYDLIHLHTEPAYLGMSYAQLIKTPVLFTSHNIYHVFEKNIFAFYDGKIYFSGLSKAQVRSIPFSGKIPVIYNGIDTATFPFERTGKNYFLFLGRLVKDKGIEEFLELAKNDPSNSYYIAGKGSTHYEELIRQTVTAHSNIQFFGMAPKGSKQWFDLLSQAKALIMPILYDDTCPLVPLEAMACGTPVIAYSRGALPEQIVHGKTGYIISTNSRDELQKAVRTLSALSSEEYRALRERSRKHIEVNFNATTMAQQYENLYKTIIANHTPL